MIGKRVLITGATNGIGKQAALELATMGADVVIVGRSEIKTRTVAQELEAQSGGTADALIADLSSMAEIRRIAAAFQAKYDRLDVLLNNAGASFSAYQRSDDGYEMTFALNHLGYYLLTNLLLDLLRRTALEAGEARVINVASSAHHSAGIEGLRLAGQGDQRRFKAFGAYSASKLANMLFTYELARRLQDSAVTVNAVNPGLVNSGMGDNMTGYMRFFFKAMKTLFGRKPRKGAETLVYLASAADVAGISAKYFFDKKQLRSSDLSYDRDQQRRLWELSAEATGVG